MPLRPLSTAVAAAALASLLAPGAVGQATCDDFWIDPSGSLDVGPEIGEVMVLLNAPSGCSYNIGLAEGFGSSWLEVYPEGVTMSGTQTDISVYWQPNENPYARTATVQIDGPNDIQFLTVRQRAGCEFSVSQTSFYFNKEAHSGSFVLTTGQDCAWTVGADGWIGVGATSGQGPATIGFSVEPNDASEGRVGHISVGSASILVAQSGVTESGSSTAPGAPPLGGSRSNTSDHSGDEDFHFEPGPELALVLGVVAAVALLARRRR